MSPIKKDDILAVAVEASLASSDLIMEAANFPRVPSHKGRTNLVTKTDIESEKIIKSIISTYFKNHSVLAEESGNEDNSSDYQWIIDPLDGTTNFIHGYPSFAVSIAVYYRKTPIVAVVIEMPSMKMYTAISDEGAFCEGRKITCSNTGSLANSLLVTGFGYEHGKNWENNMRLFKYFTDITQGVRRLGAAAIDICHVASGKVDGFWEYDLKPWDIAAGILIAQEAGCIVSTINEEKELLKSKSIIVTNPNIYNDMIYNINSYLN